MTKKKDKRPARKRAVAPSKAPPEELAKRDGMSAAKRGYGKGEPK